MNSTMFPEYNRLPYNTFMASRNAFRDCFTFFLLFLFCFLNTSEENFTGHIDCSPKKNMLELFLYAFLIYFKISNISIKKYLNLMHKRTSFIFYINYSFTPESWMCIFQLTNSYELELYRN